jgi:tetratricopeptide (TPR) repeat protein
MVRAFAERPRPSPARQWIPWLLLVGVLACADGTEPAGGPEAVRVVRIAPLEVRGQDQGGEFVGRAFAESLAAGLGAVQALRVVGPDDDEPATTVVSGELTRDGQSVTASLRLVDRAGAEVWTTELSDGTGDLSVLASSLAREVAAGLGVEYPALVEHIVNLRGGPAMAGSPRVARLWQAWNANDIDTLLAESTALVDEYGDDDDAQVLAAWALMGAWDASPSEETLVRLSERLAELKRVAPASPYDPLLRAYIYRSSGKPEQSRQLYTAVLGRTDLTPSARAWALRQRSYTHAQVGNDAAALDDAREAVRLDPVSAAAHVALSRALQAMDRLDEAAASSRDALTLEPFRWRHHQRLGVVYTRARRFADAARALERACELGDTQEACANLAVALERAERPEEAHAAARHAESLSATRWGMYNLACFRCLAGEQDGALDALERALALGFADDLIETDPDLDALRGTERFEHVVEAARSRLRSRRAQAEAVFPWQ